MDGKWHLICVMGDVWAGVLVTDLEGHSAASPQLGPGGQCGGDGGAEIDKKVTRVGLKLDICKY